MKRSTSIRIFLFIFAVALVCHPAPTRGEQASCFTLKACFDTAYHAHDDGDYSKAILYYTQALAYAEGNDIATIHSNRGYSYFSNGDYNLAMEDYNLAIKLDPSDYLIFRKRGDAYDDKGDYDRAVQDYSQAIERNPDDANAYNNRGFAYYHKGEYDLAFKDYDHALQLAPKLAMAYCNRGIIFGLKGDYDWAIEDFNQAILLDPDGEAGNRARINLKLMRQKKNSGK